MTYNEYLSEHEADREIPRTCPHCGEIEPDVLYEQDGVIIGCSECIEVS